MYHHTNIVREQRAICICGESAVKKKKHEDVVNTGLLPLDVVEGFKIRPGFFRMYGACEASNGVSFTINSHGATRCTLFIVQATGIKAVCEDSVS